MNKNLLIIAGSIVVGAVGVLVGKKVLGKQSTGLPEGYDEQVTSDEATEETEE